MPFPRLHLFRFKRAHAAVSQPEYLYAVVGPNGKVRGQFTAYTPNLRWDEQLVRVKCEGP